MVYGSLFGCDFVGLYFCCFGNFCNDVYPCFCLSFCVGGGVMVGRVVGYLMFGWSCHCMLQFGGDTSYCFVDAMEYF